MTTHAYVNHPLFLLLLELLMQALIAYRPADPWAEIALGTDQQASDPQVHLGWMLFTLVPEDVHVLRGFVDWFNGERQNVPSLVNAGFNVDSINFQYTLYEQCPALSRQFDANRNTQAESMVAAISDTVNVDQIEGVMVQQSVVGDIECNVDAHSLWFSFYLSGPQLTVQTDRITLDELAMMIRPISVEE